MDYEEYQRKALEPIVNYIESVMASYSKEELEARIKKALPEKESEDERIRKRLVEYFNGFYDRFSHRNNVNVHWEGLEVKAVIAWLEKQKEQKPVDLYEMLVHKEPYIAPVPTPIVADEQQPAGWSEEDEHLIDEATEMLRRYAECAQGGNSKIYVGCLADRIESLRPQPKEEREPMEIKYGGKVYQVYAVRSLPGGATGYIIEDEPGHYDCIIHPDEVLGGGYGIKSNGSPYPTKEANFGQPHWKPSEDQMKALEKVRTIFHHHHLWDEINPILYDYEELMRDLQKLL